MKKNTSKVMLLACIIVMSIFSTVYAMPDGYVRLGKTNVTIPVNVRLGPSTDTEIAGKLMPNDIVEVYGINSDGWYEVLYQGHKRYVYSEYLDTSTRTEYQCIGKYRTYFDPSNKNRNHNINLAAKGISIKIMPGHIFKWSEVIGPASKEQGYVLGNVIINDEMAQGYGGGVCQVSSTLYNAALEAGLEILERHTHGLPVSYVPEGKDATVAYGFLDFIFKNNKSYPIQIVAVTGNGFVEVGIYRTNF